MHSNSSQRLLIRRSCELEACALLSQGNQYQLIIIQKAWQEKPTLMESRLHWEAQRCPPCAFARAEKIGYECVCVFTGWSAWEERMIHLNNAIITHIKKCLHLQNLRRNESPAVIFKA